MRRIIFMVVSAVLIGTMVIGGPAAGQEYKSKGERGVSPTVRSDKSGQSNFGECHKPTFRDIIEDDSYGGSGEFSRNYNPSSKSSGYAECKEVEGRTSYTSLFGANECEPDDPHGDRCVVGTIGFGAEHPPTEPPGQQPLPDDDPCREDPLFCGDPCEEDPSLPECEFTDPCEEDPTLCENPCEEDPSLPECQPDPCEEDPSLCVNPCIENPTLPECGTKTPPVAEDPVEFASLGLIAPMLLMGCLLAYKTIRSRRQE